MTELHPFHNFITDESNVKGGFVPVNTNVLIIGTFPPKQEYTQKGEGFFFFSSERNHLWNRIDNIFENVPNYTPLKKTANRNNNETIPQNRLRKMKFCKNNGLGFIDIYSKIKRATADSTADADLISVENILENGNLDYIINTQNIKRICCVYILAYNEILNNLNRFGYIVNTKAYDLAANGVIHNVSKGDKNFEQVLLYPATRSRHKGDLKDNQYRHFLFDDKK